MVIPRSLAVIKGEGGEGKERIGNKEDGDGIGTRERWERVGGKGRERRGLGGKREGREGEDELAYPTVKL